MESDIQSNDQILAKALEKGYVLLNISKVVTSGAAGSGKTCTRHVLLGEKPPPRRISTALFHVSRVFRDISQELVATDKVARWFPVSGPHLNEMIARAIKKGVSHESVQHEDTAMSSKSGIEEAIEQGDGSLVSDSKLETVMNDLHVERKDPTLGYDTEQVTSEHTITTQQDILRLMEKRTGSDELMSLHWIYFIDSGGQPQFHDLLPPFLKNKSVILLVIKLSERLEEYPTIQYYSADGTGCKEYVSRATNVQILQHYCRTLVSNNKDCCVLIVGTHRDVQCTEESIEEKDKIIAQLLNPSLGDRLAKQCSQDGKILYPLNAQNPSQEDFGMAALIRKEITNPRCTQQFKVPIAWFLLEQDIQQEGKVKGIITMQECIELASKLKMNHQALLAALEYFDKLSILLYFPLSLPNIVFTDSQIIIDKVTEIVSHSYYLRSLEEENFERQQWSGFLNFGVISQEMLLKLFPTHFVPNLFTVDDLFDLFQHLLIIAQLNCDEFVMPAVLPEISAEDIESLEPNLESLTPALIYFPDGCAPGGAFCCLSVHLISECGWRIADTFYRNCLKFKVGNITVTIIDSFHYFKVYVQDPNVSSSFSACKWVIASISTGLSKACVALNYDKINHSIGILCPCKKEEHVATLDRQLLHWTCTKNSNIKGKMSDEFTPWHHLHNQVEFPTETGRKWKKAHVGKDIYNMDKGSHLKTIGLLFTFSVLIMSVYAAKYSLYPSGWSLPHRTSSERLHGHNLAPTTQEFHLPGMQLIGFETFTLQHSAELQTITWNRFGFKLHIPPDAISRHDVNTNISVGVSLSGNFKFPLNTTLVSAVYYINASSKLLQPVTIEMEHCLLLKDDDDIHALSFYVAEVYPGFPHYTFQQVRGGIFSSTNSWGSIFVSSFSLFSISWIGDIFSTAPIGYSAQVYQKKASGVMFNVRLVVTRHLSSCKEAAQSRYCEKQWTLKKDFHFHFVDDNEQQVLSLEIDDTGFGSNGWWIKPSSPPPEIHQVNVDGGAAASTPYDPAHCELTIWWIDEAATPRSLLKDIKMKGVNKRSFEVTLSDFDLKDDHSKTIRDENTMTPCELHITDTTIIEDVLQLLQAVQNIGDWFILCKTLKVEESKLNLLKESSTATEISKKTECLQTYINSGRASWEDVVTVIAQYPISNLLVAKEIANNNLEGVNKDKILQSLEACTPAALNIII